MRNPDSPHGGPGRHHAPGDPDRPHRGPRGHGRRPLDYGQIRLLLLSLIAESPRHGYELIKAVEDRFRGQYTPSPGVIYPTLAWLEDMGFATVAATAGNRKSYTLTARGQTFLEENRAALGDLLLRIGAGRRGGPPPGTPAEVIAAMDDLKAALRGRLGHGPVGDAEVARIAAAVRAAAVVVADAPPPDTPVSETR